MGMDEHAAIDLDHLEKYVAGDDDLRHEILEIFAEQISLLGRQFDIEQSDEGWRHTSHAMKGAARGVGAWKLGALCEEAERFIGAVAGKRERRAASLVAIRRQIAAAVAEVERLGAEAA